MAHHLAIPGENLINRLVKMLYGTCRERSQPGNIFPPRHWHKLSICPVQQRWYGPVVSVL